MYTRQGAKPRSLKNKLLEVFISWFQDKPAPRRSRVRRAHSLHQQPRKEAKKVFVGCFCAFIIILLVKCLVYGWNVPSEIQVLNHGVKSGKLHKQDSLQVDIGLSNSAIDGSKLSLEKTNISD